MFPYEATQHQSPTILAQGASLVENIFSTIGRFWYGLVATLKSHRVFLDEKEHNNPHWLSEQKP